MKSTHPWTKTAAISACLIVVLTAGCESWWANQRSGPAALGTISDPIWQNQEVNAEMSDFVVYQHEFERNSEWLTTNGEDHVKQIAARLQQGQDAQVVVERSMVSARADTTHKYPVHPNPELDLQRRDIIVRSLLALGVEDADERVLVAPAFAQGITGNEGEQAYIRALGGNQYGGGMGGFGGFMFGGGGFF